MHIILRIGRRNQNASIWCVLWGYWSKFRLWLHSQKRLRKFALITAALEQLCLDYLHFTSRYGFPKLNASYIPFWYKKRLKWKYRQEVLKCTFLPAELERGTKALQSIQFFWSLVCSMFLHTACKWWNTGGGEGLGTRLSFPYSSVKLNVWIMLAVYVQ